MKKSDAAHLHVLSAMTADPTKAARAMLDTSKRHLKMTRRQISLNTLEKLVRKQLGTEDVERMSTKVIKDAKGKQRDVGYIMFVMKRRKKDAEEQMRKAKVDWRNTIKYLNELLPTRVMEQYTKFLKEVVEKLWKEGCKTMRKKVRTLEERYHPWTKPMEPKIRDIKISDEELAPMEEQEEEVSVPIYGGVQVPLEVKHVLKLPPKFALYPKIDMKVVEMEVERGIWKARWEDRSQEQREGRQEPNEEEQEEMMGETRVWDGETKELDYSKIRVTQIPTNRRVIPPKPLTRSSKTKELDLQFMKARLLDETRKHLKTEYDDKGRPKENNITPLEVKGLKAAKDLTENGDVIIRPTDKTGKHSIDTHQNYVDKMQVHIGKDAVITEQEKERCVRECNGHSAFWRRIVGLGDAHPAADALGDRLTSALTQDQFMLPPPMVGNAKDHKEGDNPPLRAICQAKSAPNNILSWIMAKVVGKVGEEAPESKAMYATEEMQDMMTKVNSKLTERRVTREVGIGSMDVVGLYPALEKGKVKTILKEMLLRTKVKVAQINWKEVGVYLACAHSQEEIDHEGLEEVVPRWRYRPQGGGNRPGITSKRAMMGAGEEEEEEDDGDGGGGRRRRGAGAASSWLPPERLPTEDEKSRMFAMAVVAGVMGAMSNHCYRFEQQTRRQNDGGSIGNQLTGEVADVVMAWWTGEFKKLASTATIDLMSEFLIDSGLYVDDYNLAYFVLPAGTRWDEEERKMIIKEDEIEEDNQKPADMRTMVEMTKMANSIITIIKWTHDCPGANQSGKMPILNLKVWISGEIGEQKILFEPYRKPMAARTLILARSAMPSRIKRASFTQEALTLLRNCSPETPWKRKAEFLSDFCLRMKISGYPQQYRKAIIESALAAWDKILLEDQFGLKPLYRSNDWKKEERRKEKEKKRSGWFRRMGGSKNDFPIFCPITPGSRLAERWKKVAEEVRLNSGGKLRPTVVEQTGLPISALLVNPMQGELDDCGKEDCNPCQSGTTRKLSCRRSSLGGMVYGCECMICRENENPVKTEERLKSMYHGRTCRCLYSRQREHNTGMVGKQQENAMHKHMELFHPNMEPRFVFGAEKFFRDASSHQIYEGICINNSPSTPGYLMNSRAEYEQGGVARLVVAHGL